MRKIHKILTLFSLVVIIGYQVITICLSHAHIVGQNLIVHYHPFDAGEKQTHAHSADELLLIQNLFPTIVSIVALAFFLSVFLVLKRVLAVFCESVSVSIRVYTGYNRGPPSLV